MVAVRKMVTLKAHEVSSYIRQNRKLMVLTALFLLGLVIGSLVVRTMGQEDIGRVNSLMRTHFTVREKQTFYQIVWSSFLAGFFYLAVNFVNGLSLISFPLAAAIPVFRGLGVGTCIGYLYMTYGFQGMLYAAATVLLPVLLSTFAIVMSAKESVNLSFALIGRCLQEKHTGKPGQILKKYVVVQGMCLVVLAISAVLEGLLYLMFSPIFTFIS